MIDVPGLLAGKGWLFLTHPFVLAERTRHTLGGDFPVSAGSQDVIEWLQEVTDCAAQIGPLARKTMCEGRVSCVWLGPSYSC